MSETRWETAVRVRAPGWDAFRYGLRIVLGCLPRARRQLWAWRERASAIADPECRRQALGSIDHKAFHSLGAAVFGALAHPRWRARVVDFAVAFQTLSDYLDNLSDRSRPQGLLARRRLHRAIEQAADPLAPRVSCGFAADGGYLEELVDACRARLAPLPALAHAVESIRKLTRLYARMQALKHGPAGRRRRWMTRWSEREAGDLTRLAWWEFAAACGSTLGVFALAARATYPQGGGQEPGRLMGAYFPWICALHILLDYLIDLEEDAATGELNFAACYRRRTRAEARIDWLYRKSLSLAESLPAPAFHRLVVAGLAAVYLTDPKARPFRALRDRLARRDGLLRRLLPLVRAWRSACPPAPPQVEPAWQEGGPVRRKKEKEFALDG